MSGRNDNQIFTEIMTIWTWAMFNIFSRQYLLLPQFSMQIIVALANVYGACLNPEHGFLIAYIMVLF